MIVDNEGKRSVTATPGTTVDPGISCHVISGLCFPRITTPVVLGLASMLFWDLSFWP